MKSVRHQRILEIINQTPIQTQEELLTHLRKEGFAVTQATVSRDIKELNLIKIRNGSGISAYSKHEMAADLPDGEKYAQIMRTLALRVEHAGNLVVIKCRNGMASAACASLDALNWEENVVGTLAGDDTILVVTRSEKNARLLCADLRALLAL
ncbi:MAG: arginine repressor [Oscillospiraceae bacterium]|nr:arginine repressor [Oscillospiraceae bacterium]